MTVPTPDEQRPEHERGSVDSERTALALLAGQLRRPEERDLRERIAGVLGHGEMFTDALNRLQASGVPADQEWVAQTRRSWLGARQELRTALPDDPATDRDRSTASALEQIMAGYDRLHPRPEGGATMALDPHDRKGVMEEFHAVRYETFRLRSEIQFGTADPALKEAAQNVVQHGQTYVGMLSGLNRRDRTPAEAGRAQQDWITARAALRRAGPDQAITDVLDITDRTRTATPRPEAPRPHAPRQQRRQDERPHRDQAPGSRQQ